MSFTVRQRVAITRPCRLAGETVHSRFATALCGTPSDAERTHAYDAWVQGYLERARAALK